jgi:hypothetical protein
MQYNGNPVVIKTINARSLPHKKLPKPARSVLGANMLGGFVRPENLTRAMMAAIVGVSVTYLDIASRLTPEQRAAVLRGERTLFMPRTKPALPKPEKKLAEVVAEIGVDQTLALLAANENRVAA